VDWLRLADALPLLGCAMLLAAALTSRVDAATSLTSATLTVDADFPGGNLLVEKIDGDAVWVRQDLRDTRGTWFWWHFRVRGAAGRTLTFHFTNGNVLGVRGPAVSTDGGGTWAWLGRRAVRGTSFRYAFAPDAGEVRFCFAMPYFEADLKRFLKRFKGSPHLKVSTLCKSRKGRGVERLRVGRVTGEPDHRVVVTCRHHCCECMASYSLEGIVEAVLADTPDGRWLRRHVELMAIPFMDKDGVEDGDQGKNRKPHDHNRDYGATCIYPSVQAIRELVPRWSRGKLHAAFDLHCPHIRGTHNEAIYMVGSPSEPIWRAQRAFGKLLETLRTGPLPYHARNNLAFGKGWNTHRNYGDGKSSSRWMGEQPGIWLATSFEIPYANASGQPVTAHSARAFGHDLAKALRRFLESPPPAASPPAGE